MQRQQIELNEDNNVPLTLESIQQNLSLILPEDRPIRIFTDGSVIEDKEKRKYGSFAIVILEDTTVKVQHPEEYWKE